MGIFLILPSRSLRVRLLSLPGYGEKQELKNTLIHMNSQEEICLPQLLPFSGQSRRFALGNVALSGRLKNKTSGSAPQSQIPVVSGPEAEHILPIQPAEKNKEMFLFNLQTVGSLALKTATNIADIQAPGTALLCETVSRKNILGLSQTQRLSSERSERS